MTTAQETAAKAMEENGLTVSFVFVPFSKSRNRKEKDKSLNYRVTLLHKGREVMTTDYMMGCGHCPAYKNPSTFPNGKRDDFATRRRIAEECEKGRAVKGEFANIGVFWYGPAILPDAEDVVHSLITDAGCAADARDFDDFCADLGYDNDSRKAEAMYRACLDTFMKLRSTLGEPALSELRDAFRDY